MCLCFNLVTDFSDISHLFPQILSAIFDRNNRLRERERFSSFLKALSLIIDHRQKMRSSLISFLHQAEPIDNQMTLSLTAGCRYAEPLTRSVAFLFSHARHLKIECPIGSVIPVSAGVGSSNFSELMTSLFGDQYLLAERFFQHHLLFESLPQGH